ncbi:unnamed protein product [Meloidogyne enterolobii]|uniref:Uncharacterized protein n=1 Tax=Meloidogyne enterolobii TaxID=390850 RepID=A0ACB0ZDM6_MELEN
MVKKMCKALGMLNVLASRAFTTSNIRALRFGSQRTQQSDIFQVGAFLPENSKSQIYQKGQLFVHKIFAYRFVDFFKFSLA